MTDKERVLLNIAVDTSGSIWDKTERLQRGWALRFTVSGRPAPQFIPIELAEIINLPLKSGDIIRCCTNPNHDWGISEFVEQKGYADFLLREIGGKRLCNMGNESIEVLRFMRPERLYTGLKYKLWKWAYKAFQERYNPNYSYFKRCGGVEFENDYLILWSRAHIWAMQKHPKMCPVLFAQPKKFIIPYTNKTRLKDIVNSMEEQGFADDYVYLPYKPTEGQGGYATFTKEDVLKVIA